jgi:rhodanese-related sulfurtransferase
VSRSTVSREELRQKIERGDSFLLFEVLPEPYYRKHHLPGALHMPPNDVVAAVAAQGYTNVREYAAGKKDWREAGLPIERLEPQASGVPEPDATGAV